MNKKVLAIGTAGGLALGMGGTAFAFFTSNGTATGAATVGSAANWKISITGTTGAALLYPDPSIGKGSIQTDSVTVQNVGNGDQHLASLTVEVANSDGSAFSYQPDPNEPACTAADFSLGGAPAGHAFVDTSGPLAGTYTAGESQTGGVAIQMIDNGANQDNCQNVTIPLYFTVGTAPAAPNAALSIDPSPPVGSGGFYPNPTYLTEPTIGVDTAASLTVTAVQPGAELPDGTIAVAYNNTYLTFTGASPDATCAAPTVSGTTSTVTCSYTDLAHSDSSKPFNFTTDKAGATSVTATVTIGANSASQSFALNIG